MTNHYAVLIQCQTGIVPIEHIQKVLNTAKDWARFAPNIWFIATNATAEYWFGSVRAVLQPNDNIVVQRIDLSDRNGWATKPIIDWYNRDQDNRLGV